MRKKNKAFTLIELIVVLVILAVIALIATPIVLNIVDNAQVSANKRSVDAYGKAVELAVAEYLLDTGDYPTTLDDLDVKYSGNEVVCNVRKINEQGSIYISECSVDDVKVKDETTNDGYYHYSSYSYKVYKVGDKITYNGIDFYVIEDSDKENDSVTLLKAEPLTVDEVNTYGAGHVNMYVTSDTSATGYQSAYDYNGYGSIAYYSSATCGYDENSNHSLAGCTNAYDASEVKYVVDNWSTEKLRSSDLTEDRLGYKVRLITKDEYAQNCEITQVETPSSTYDKYIPQYDWMYNNNYFYWTMSGYEDYVTNVWQVNTSGEVSTGYINAAVGGGGMTHATVRPVITLSKSAIN